MNKITVIIIAFIFLIWLIETIADLLNIKNISTNIPSEFEGYFKQDEYVRSQKYLKAQTKFSFVYSAFFLICQIVLIVSGGFNATDILARSFGFNEILTGLIFGGILLFALELLKIPFSIYSTFAIEEKFGFNKTTIKIFITDLLKSWIIGAIIASILFSSIIWFFINFKEFAWLYAFLGVIAIEVFIIFVYPILIMPLFNKYTPLEDGDLKQTIEKYAEIENFKMKGLFKMDGSKRSTKANAFFTGFGRFRRIVLFDTLIQNHTIDELTSVLAHEMGHFKLGHIIKTLVFSFLSTGFMFFILSLFINSNWLYEAFYMQNKSVYSGIIFFAFLYTPISFIISIISSSISRIHEYEADKYAVRTYKKPQALIDALKKLSVNNLSNLTPHPFKVLLEYSHPPILKRIEAIKKLQ